MKAILLAAGQGKRFGNQNEWGCKVLIEVGGECLLDRHLDALFRHGVSEVIIVIGYEARRIEDRLDLVGLGRAIRTLDNPRYREGSLYSLFLARADLESAGGCLVMDADVLYDPSLIRVLVQSKASNGVLFDGGFVDEEMKIGVRGGRAVELGKKIRAEDYEAIGRGPGFYKVGSSAGPAFARVLCAMVDEGLAHLEYEDAFTRLFKDHKFSPVDVGGRAWTEIDNLVDLERAKTEIWPRIHPG